MTPPDRKTDAPFPTLYIERSTTTSVDDLSESQRPKNDGSCTPILGWRRPCIWRAFSPNRARQFPYGYFGAFRVAGKEDSQPVLDGDAGSDNQKRVGKEYRRLVSAFERIFGSTIFFGTESSRLPAKLVHRSRFNFLCEAQIWYNQDSVQPPLSDEFANVIVLSKEFNRESSEHPIPADREAVKVLASAPAVLDLFVWLTYRCFSAKGPEQIPLFGSYGLAQQLGCVEYSRPRRFRAMLNHWLVSIRLLWPNCPAVVSCPFGKPA